VLNQHAAASDAGKFVKNLLPDEAIEPIKKLDGEIRQFHYDNTVPWGDDGLRLLPILRYDPYMEKMRQNRAARETLVQKFLENYQHHRMSQCHNTPLANSRTLPATTQRALSQKRNGRLP